LMRIKRNNGQIKTYNIAINMATQDCWLNIEQ
jgi:hypothetical protein